MNLPVSVSDIYPSGITYSSDSLSGNKENFYKILSRRLFLIKLKYMRYSIQGSVLATPLIAKRVEDEDLDELSQKLNLTEGEALNKISQQTKVEAEAIADEILHYFDASKKTVHSEGDDNHIETNYTTNDNHKVNSDDECGIKF